jgi:hypothetical protein
MTGNSKVTGPNSCTRASERVFTRSDFKSGFGGFRGYKPPAPAAYSRARPPGVVLHPPLLDYDRRLLQRVKDLPIDALPEQRRSCLSIWPTAESDTALGTEAWRSISVHKSSDSRTRVCGRCSEVDLADLLRLAIQSLNLKRIYFNGSCAPQHFYRKDQPI